MPRAQDAQERPVREPQLLPLASAKRTQSPVDQAPRSFDLLLDDRAQREQRETEED
jgi:hypothetical protein